MAERIALADRVVATFGGRLRALREARGWRPRPFSAHAFGSHAAEGYLSYLETGKRTPGSRMLVLLALALDVSVDDLLLGDP